VVFFIGRIEFKLKNVESESGLKKIRGKFLAISSYESKQ
jgi:hypothetical protein